MFISRLWHNAGGDIGANNRSHTTGNPNLTSEQFSRFPYERLKPGGSVPNGALLPAGFAPHGLFFEAVAVDDGIKRVAQRFEVAPIVA
ncbi:MAG: hypothetical protein PVJ19_06765 [Desulfobacteraceae bacterium]|jgi:hypothetical protein